jgi:hypothetical protein
MPVVEAVQTFVGIVNENEFGSSLVLVTQVECPRTVYTDLDRSICKTYLTSTARLTYYRMIGSQCRL